MEHYEERLYPPSLRLRLVQVVHRHGERTPLVSLEGKFPVERWRMCFLGCSSLHATLLQQERKKTLLPSIFQENHPPIETPISFSNSHRMFRLQEECPSELQRAESFVSSSHSSQTVSRLRERIEQDMELPPESTAGFCYLSQLTDRGRHTLQQLGQRLRAMYVDRLGFLPSQFSPSAVYLRSTEYARAVESLQSLMFGLYPPTTPNLSNDSESQFAIHTRLEKDENMYEDNSCSSLVKYYRSFVQSFLKENAVEHASIANYFRTSVLSDAPPNISIHKLHDYFASFIANGVPLSPAFNWSLWQRIREDAFWKNYGHYVESPRAASLAIGRFVKDLLDPMKAACTSDTQPLLRVYSGHDSTLAPLLACFKLLPGRMAAGNAWPPFGSSLIFELHESVDRPYEHWVRMRYLEKPQILPDCAGKTHPDDPTLCDARRWFEIALKAVPTAYSNECAKVFIEGTEKESSL